MRKIFFTLTFLLLAKPVFAQNLQTIFEAVREKNFTKAQALLKQTESDCGFLGCRDFEFTNDDGKVESVSRQEIQRDIKSIETQSGWCEQKYQKIKQEHNSWWFKTNCGEGSPLGRLLTRTSAYSGINLIAAFPDYVQLAESHFKGVEESKKKERSVQEQKEIQKRRFEESPQGIAKTLCEWRQTKKFYQQQLTRQKKIEEIGGVSNLRAKRELAEGIALADEAIEHQSARYRRKANVDWSWNNCN